MQCCWVVLFCRPAAHQAVILQAGPLVDALEGAGDGRARVGGRVARAAPAGGARLGAALRLALLALGRRVGLLLYKRHSNMLRHVHQQAGVQNTRSMHCTLWVLATEKASHLESGLNLSLTQQPPTISQGARQGSMHSLIMLREMPQR